MISFLIILVCIYIWCDEKDKEDERRVNYRISERRHKELLEVQRRRSGAGRKQSSRPVNRKVRTVARDEKGRFVAQEISESYAEE